MTFRGGYERDMKEFVEKTPEMQAAVEVEDDDTVDSIAARFNPRYSEQKWLDATGRAC